MSKPQSAIAVHVAREWRIRRPYVYRYLEREYVDRFFKEGALRVSSFAQFAEHPDEERQDGKEGWGTVIQTTPGGAAGHTLFAHMSQGANAYVLCGSTIFSTELAVR
jgi:hypothetical protein